MENPRIGCAPASLLLSMLDRHVGNCDIRKYTIVSVLDGANPGEDLTMMLGVAVFLPFGAHASALIFS